MSWFTNLEKSIAGKLAKVFTKAKDLAEDAVSDVAKAEAALVAAKAKAAEATKAAHDAAIAAVEKQYETLKETVSGKKQLAEAANIISNPDPYNLVSTEPVVHLLHHLGFAALATVGRARFRTCLASSLKAAILS